jgi:acyl-CoA reductase-like NAD-dependent aldehyde dehydrogenase
MSTFSIENPATGATLRTLEADSPESVKTKLARARAGQSAWRARPLRERIEAIRRFRGAIERDKERLAAITTSEVGKPIAQSRNELNGLLGRVDFFLAESERTLAREEVMADGGMVELIEHEPLGVVANISAWNYPYFVGSNVFVPALIAGNAVLYKPSEHATLTGLALAEALHASGVPEDVFIPILGAGAIGAAVSDLPVDGIFFTGSYATGRKVAEAAGRSMTRVQLELGGKDPVYIADDVDPKAAAAGTADGAFYNAGQSCCAVERIYVHEAIADRFIEAFIEEVRGFKVGDPTDDTTYIGPLTRGAQLAVLEAQIADAKQKGATGRARRRAPGSPWALLRADGAHGRERHHERHARGVLRADHRHPARERRRAGGGRDERHRIRAHGGRVHEGPRACRAHPVARRRRLGLLELLRSRQPAAALVRPATLRARPHALALRHLGLHQAQGLAPALAGLRPTRMSLHHLTPRSGSLHRS